jgi:CPA2 family monovalent cation:H+ antiporter-2
MKERTANLEGHVIIAGYGLSGRNVGRVLREMQIPYIFIELNSDAVRTGRKSGEFIIYGDATAPAVLEELGIKRARALVLAINDPAALTRAIHIGRELNRDIYILARTRYIAELDYLRELGADEIIPDELESSLQLSAYLLQRFGIAEGKIMLHLAQLRREHYSRLRPDRREEDEVRPLSVLEGGRIEFQAVPENSPCLGRSLSELAFRSRTGAMVMGVIRRERTLYNVPPHLCLERGDTLMLLGNAEEIRQARNLLHGETG